MLRQQCGGSDGNFITTKEWQGWCRLCAKTNGYYIDAFSEQTGEQAISNVNITAVIEKYFQILFKPNAEEPVLLCSECCNNVKSLNNYAEHIKKVQQMYESLQNIEEFTDINLKGLYQKFNIGKCEVFLPQLLPGIDISSTTAIEQIFVDTHGPDIVIKDEEIEETEANAVDNKTEIKIEIPDPFASGNQDKEEYTEVEEDYDHDEDKPCPSSADENDSDDNKDFDNTLFACKDSKDGQYTCYVCKQRFKQTRNYVWHMKRKHDVETPLYNCEQCSATFRRRKELDRHIRKAHEPRIYPCPHCSRIFKLKKVVENHIKKEHEGQGFFICEECGESVRTKERLLEHMAIHTGGAFECEECGKRFARKNYLKKHLEIHGDKHICGECGAEVTTSKALKNHMKVHSDEMPYKCNYCGKRFKRTKNLKNHLITHTGLKPYSCDFCDKTFSTGSSCRYHKKHLHPKELAAMEAAGIKAYTKNIPKMAVLKAITQAAGEVVKTGDSVTDKRIRLPKLDSDLPDT